ncbi:Protein of unknown function (DUF3812) domain containing protein [Naviculisporaceae sp. PSN 640]
MTSTAITTPLASSNRSGRLRYASAQELPSFPSIGLKNDGAAASVAATLGWATQSPPGLWKPDSTSESASTAALLANDKMATVSDPQRAQTAAGSQAAIMAASSVRRRENNQSSPPSLWGSSAANLAFKASMSSQQHPPSTPGTTTLTRKGSMHAAKGAMAGTLRPRAISSPMPEGQSYPDKANAASNALSAATIAHRPSTRATNIPVGEAGAVPFTNMNRQMYTSNPPVKPETDEQKRNDVLHASALAMAKRMYTQHQQKEQLQKASKAPVTRGRASSFSRHGEENNSRGLTEDEPVPIVYGNLQEAAYRLAQERLAKLQDEHQKNRDLQQYYGAAGPSQRPGKFGSIRTKLTRKRSSSDGDLVMEDQIRSRQIRNQMSLFNNKLMEVDEQKRTKDREALLAAAQRNVRAKLQDMDNKIQSEQGVLATSGGGHPMDWERKAQAAAQARFDASHNPNYGKIDIGGGKFMDKDEVEQIAAKKVQPLLDEINKNAEKEYERRLQAKADEERRREEEEKNRAREREIQAIHKKLKDQQKDEDKVRKAELKQLEKNQKEQAKAAKAEQKRMAREGKGKEKEIIVVPPVSTEGAGGETVLSPPAEKEAEKKEDKKSEPEKEKPEKKSEGLSRALSIKFQKVHGKQKDPKGKEKEAAPAPAPIATSTTPIDKEEVSATSPSSPPSATTNKVKSWIKSHLHHRSRSKSGPVGGEEDGTLSHGAKDNKKQEPGFIGGAALARLSASSSGSSFESADDTKRTRATTSPPSTSTRPKGDIFVEEDDLVVPHRDSMRDVALAGRADYLTDPDHSRSGFRYDEEGESSSRAAGAIDVPTPPPAPIPVPIPVVITTSEVSAQPEVAAIITTTDTTTTTTQSSNNNKPRDKSLNKDGVSAESTDTEDGGETNTYSILGLKKEELSAVEKFGTEDWDTSTPAAVGTRGRGRKRTESVSSLSSSDLSDELDTDDETGKGGRYSLEKFREARAEMERPRMPPRVSSADVIGVVDEVSVDGDDGKEGYREQEKNDKFLGSGKRPVERGISPYRESRFSEDL